MTKMTNMYIYLQGYTFKEAEDGRGYGGRWEVDGEKLSIFSLLCCSFLQSASGGGGTVHIFQDMDEKVIIIQGYYSEKGVNMAGDSNNGVYVEKQYI